MAMSGPAVFCIEAETWVCVAFFCHFAGEQWFLVRTIWPATASFQEAFGSVQHAAATAAVCYVRVQTARGLGGMAISTKSVEAGRSAVVMAANQSSARPAGQQAGRWRRSDSGIITA